MAACNDYHSLWMKIPNDDGGGGGDGDGDDPFCNPMGYNWVPENEKH